MPVSVRHLLTEHSKRETARIPILLYSSILLYDAMMCRLFYGNDVNVEKSNDVFSWMKDAKRGL